MLTIKKALYNNLLALLSGLLLTLVQPPFFFVFLLPIALFLFFMAVDNARSKKEIFMLGWLCGFVYFGTGLYWIGNSLFAEGSGQFIWLWPFCALGIPALLANYIGLCALFSSWFPVGWMRTMALPLYWLFFELLRTYVPLPFPWHLLGYTAGFDKGFMQLGSIVGVYGLGFLLMLSASLCCTARPITGILLFFALWGAGQWLLEQANETQKHVATNINLRIVQPNLAMHQFNDKNYAYNSFNKILELSIQPAANKLDYIIWPEGSFAFGLNENSLWYERLQSLFPHTTLIFGADFYSDNNKNYNSIIYLPSWHESNKSKWDRYDKTILVPFGEYVPLKQFLPFVNKIAHGIGDGFSPGDGHNKVLPLSKGKHALMAICYEIIFTQHFLPHAQYGDFIINITNDAWFGYSIGPQQHLVMAQMRAVETGLPIIRAANSGISAVIKADGSILQQKKLNVAGVLDIELPSKKVAPTFYNLHFKKIFAISACVFFLFNILRLGAFLYLKQRHINDK